jgi:hypothetical protein
VIGFERLGLEAEVLKCMVKVHSEGSLGAMRFSEVLVVVAMSVTSSVELLPVD